MLLNKRNLENFIRGNISKQNFCVSEVADYFDVSGFGKLIDINEFANIVRSYGFFPNFLVFSFSAMKSYRYETETSK